MKMDEFTRIKELISKAELSSAKAQGQIDMIKADWKKKYGTDDSSEIKEKMKELVSQKEKLTSKKEELENRLANAYDWDSLESELL